MENFEPLKSPDKLFVEKSGLHSADPRSTEYEFCVVLYWAIIANLSKRVLEIGTYLGHSTYWLNAAVEKIGGHVDTLDPVNIESRYPNQASVDWGVVRRNKSTTRHRSTSNSWFEKNPQSVYDFVYVDGDHKYGQAKLDIVNAKEHLAPGGIIAVHDTTLLPEVARALDDADVGGTWLKFNQGKGMSIGKF